ncbi:MAG: hypothetical protein QXF76_00115 [Candidatus Anstonellales archaeon]
MTQLMDYELQEIQMIKELLQKDSLKNFDNLKGIEKISLVESLISSKSKKKNSLNILPILRVKEIKEYFPKNQNFCEVIESACNPLKVSEILFNSYELKNELFIPGVIINPLPDLEILKSLKYSFASKNLVTVIQWPIIDFIQIGIGDAIILNIKQIESSNLDILELIDEAHSYSQEVVLQVYDEDDLEIALQSEGDVIVVPFNSYNYDHQIKNTNQTSHHAINYRNFLIEHLNSREIEREIVFSCSSIADLKQLISMKLTFSYSCAISFNDLFNSNTN